MEISTLSIVAILTDWIWPIFLFVFGLGAVVFVHELGHFLVAKAVGIKVERFAIGFGPRVCGYRGKETDYSIMLLPLGGYVKMLGQEDFAPLKEGEEPDPRAYSSKSVGARFAVISAGVIMNVIFAAILFVIIGMIGMSTPAPIVGGTAPGMPANTAKITWRDDAGLPINPEDPRIANEPNTIQPGDRMKKIEGDGALMTILGNDVYRFRRVQMQAVLSDITDKYTLTVERSTKEGKRLTGTLSLGLKMSLSPSGTGSKLPAFGIAPASSNKLIRVDKYGHEDTAGFKPGDEIVKVDGKEVKHNWDIEKIAKNLLGRPVKVTVERTENGKTSQVELGPFQPSVRNPLVFHLKDGTKTIRAEGFEFNKKNKQVNLIVGKGDKQTEQKVPLKNIVGYETAEGVVTEYMDVLGLSPRLKVGAVVKGSPAEDAKLQPGDIIARYGAHPAPTYLKLKELNKKFVDDGADIVVIRDGKTLAPVKIKPKMYGQDAQIGIIVELDMENLIIAGIRENSPASKPNTIRGDGGDLIEKINGKDVSTWPELLAELSKLQDKEVTIAVKRGDESVTATIKSLDKEMFQASDYACRILPQPWYYERLMDPKISRGPIDALVWGCKETVFFITTSYATLRSLIKRTVSPAELSGPVGIGRMAIMAGRRGVLHFVYFMAIISVSLAVVNFLPFPVVDGGHALFLIIEKIRGKPLSIRVMNVVQLIGLAVILMVFVLVTWQDISRILKS